MERVHSKVGIASFFISFLAGLVILAAFVSAGIFFSKYPESPYPGQTALGLTIIFALFADFGAVTLGVCSLFQKDRKRKFGILGLVISLVTVLIAIALLLLGAYLIHR